MSWILSILINTVPCLLVLIPLALLFSCLFPKDRRLTIWIFSLLFSFLLTAMFLVTGVPSIYSLCSYPAYCGPVQWIPFADMLRDPVQYLLNLFLFIPLGFCLPFLSPVFQQLKKALLLGVSLSILIEILHLFNFRATDINDFLSNTAGTALGFILAKLLLKAFAKQRSFELFSGKWSVAGPLLLCAAAFFIIFFIEPILSGLIWESYYSFDCKPVYSASSSSLRANLAGTFTVLL